jgi:hypothetical protein
MQNKESSLTCANFPSIMLSIIFRAYCIALCVMLCSAALVNYFT